MADDNKPMQYMRYAVGEIALVVIGILIALQINNWNIQRQKDKLEKVLLEQVKQELMLMNNDIEGDMMELNLAGISHDKIETYFKENKKYADSMCFDFYCLIADEYIYPKEAAYGRIKEEGLDIIKNDSLRRGIQFIYEGLFPRISKINPFYQDIGDLFSDYYLDHFKPNTDMSLQFEFVYEKDTISYPDTYIKNGKEEKYTTGYVPLDFEALKKDTKFQMLMNKAQKYRSYKVYRYDLSHRVIASVVQKINTELGIEQDHKQ